MHQTYDLLFEGSFICWKYYYLLPCAHMQQHLVPSVCIYVYLTVGPKIKGFSMGVF